MPEGMQPGGDRAGWGHPARGLSACGANGSAAFSNPDVHRDAALCFRAGTSCHTRPHVPPATSLTLCALTDIVALRRGRQTPIVVGFQSRAQTIGVGLL